MKKKKVSGILFKLLLPYPIPKEQVSKLQESNNCLNTGHLQISKPPQFFLATGRGFKNELRFVCKWLRYPGHKSDFKTDSTLVTETINRQYNT